MNDTALWIVAGGGSGIIAFITFWMTMATRMANAESKADSAEKRAQNAEHMATIAIAKNEVMARDLGADRVDMASKIAALEALARTTSTALTQAEIRLAKSIEDMGSKIDHLSDTLIKTLSEILAQGRMPFQRGLNKDQH